MRRYVLIAGTVALVGCQVAPSINASHPGSTTAQSGPRGAVSTPDWVQDAVFYQIFPERFDNGDRRNDPPGVKPWGSPPENFNYMGGDLQGVINRLPYLKDLGINTIYFNPIFAASSNHKYNTRDYRIIDPHFGDLKTFQTLLSRAHGMGIKVVLDGVFNHTGDDFWAFKDAEAKGPTSKYWHWYSIWGHPIVKDPKPNYNAWWGFATLPQLRAKENPEVQNMLFEAVEYWTRMGIDGWRLDVPNEIDSDDFWRRFRTTVKRINPNAYICGELWHDAHRWLQGDQFDAVMNYVFRDNMLGFFAKGTMNVDQMDANLEKLRKTYDPAVTKVMFNLLGSHDTPRFLTEAGHDVDSLLLALTFQMTYVGAPVIYYGDEIGMTGGKDPDCRKAMVWDAGRQNKQIQHHAKQLIAWRHQFPSLRRGEFRTLMRHNDFGMWAYERATAGDRTVVALNLGRQARPVTLDVAWPDGTPLTDLFSKQLVTVQGGKATIAAVPARGAVMLRAASTRR